MRGRFARIIDEAVWLADEVRGTIQESVMPIIVNLDVMLARRKMKLSDLSAAVDISLANLSILKNGRARAVRFSTLDALCRALDCQPGDLLEFRFETSKPTNLVVVKSGR